jgi:predicted NBD/HSP70 family sugar kinase
MKSIQEIILNLSEEGKELFGLFQKKGPLTKQDLLPIIKTNLSTLNRMIQPLEDERLLVESGIGESSGGRKPVLYDLNVSKFFVLGIDISRPYTQLVITDPKMHILKKQIFLMDESYTPEKTAQQIHQLFLEAIAELGIEKTLFLGAGLGTVGPLDRKKGIMINPKNFAAPGWRGMAIKQILEQRLQLPVLIDNGANTAVLAEQLFGMGKDFQNIAYFNCSVGIRTGATSAGTIVRSINDAEDAFGHMVVDVDGDFCDCGNYGCIDCYASIHSIVKKFGAAVKRARSTRIQKPVDQINYVEICQAAEAGDELAREIISGAAAIFGAGLANYINLLNPGLVILSGPLVSQSDLYYQISIETALKRLYTKENGRIVFSKGGHFGDDAISVGAAVMIVENALSQ